MFDRLRHHALCFFRSARSRSGKVTIAASILGFVTILGAFFILFELRVPSASADDVTTSVTVLNTPPVWTVNATENPASSTTTPTNAGSTVTFTATATDSNAESYYLIICKTSGAPTANSSTQPTCNGGVSNQWAVSALTASAAQATAATTTIETFPFANELNDWYGWVCDANTSLPRCNLTYTQGSGEAASPFVVNHPPVFASVSNDGPAEPGETVTWTSVSYDNDVESIPDTVQLFVCKANDFNGSNCGTGGSWATSTLVASNAATTTPIVIPTQDALYSAYVFLMDNHGRVATSTVQGTNSSFTVSNVAPSITAASISLEKIGGGIGDLALVTPNGTSGPFRVDFEVVDNNSCLTSVAGNEITLAIANIYRSGIGSASCDVPAEYNSNSCYAAQSPYFNDLSCSQLASQCSGSSDTVVTWRCTFNMWYNADPTEEAITTPWSAENWLASVRANDDDFASTTLTEDIDGNDLGTFLAFDATTTAIGYGGLEPGQQTDPLASSTNLMAVGNVGLGELLYGDTMCTTWTTADSCDTNGVNAANDIPVANQRFATSTVAFSNATVLTGSTSPSALDIRVLKTTATSSPAQKNTYWGISIPVAITVAGNYTGQNTLTATISNYLFW
ncbi:MAG: hypothetical protein WAZ27_03845 [Minisyncoccia bacterium]